MTTTARVDVAHAPPARNERPTRDRAHAGSPAPTTLAEAALVACSLALVFGFSRVFEDRSFFWRLAIFSVVSHGLAIAVRRVGRGILVSALASLVGLALTTGLVLYRDTTTLFFPTFRTRDAIRADFDGAWKIFLDERTPVVVHPGFVLAACLAMWLVAFLGDWAGFRVWSPFEALAPGAVVFVFCSLEAAPQDRLASTFLYAGTALLFLLLHRASRIDRSANWLAADPTRGRQALVRTGIATAMAAVVIGGILGPSLPGSDSEGAIAWRRIGKSDKQDDSRVTVSPLVTIRSRLVNQANVEAFRVVADQPDYWRLTALDLFDGANWTSSGEYQTAKGQLPSTLPSGVPTRVLTQQFEIAALGPPWLPAAYEPLSVTEDGGTRAIYESESGTLTIGNKVASAEGASYTVSSRVPTRDLALLNAATDAAVPAVIRDRYAAPPPGLTSFVRQRAAQAVRGATSPFQKALALQNFFRSDAFTYSLNVSLDQGVDSIDRFLRTRLGYCEQFASAYAAMARHLGLPARIAVGFTPGEQDTDGAWIVRGEHAHSWPEVYLAGAGWVRFEPTPGRGAPGDQTYTGIPFQQASAGDPSTATTVPPTTSIAPTPDATGPTEIPDLGALADSEVVEQETSGGGLLSSNSTAVRAVVRTILGVLVAGLLAVVAVPVTKLARRVRRRRSLGVSGRGRIAAAWEDAIDALGMLPVPISEASTPLEVANQVTRDVPEGARAPLATLAGLTTEARYASDEPSTDAQRAAADAARNVRASMIAHVSWKRRLGRAFDPRPLLPRASVST